MHILLLAKISFLNLWVHVWEFWNRSISLSLLTTFPIVGYLKCIFKVDYTSQGTGNGLWSHQFKFSPDFQQWTKIIITKNCLVFFWGNGSMVPLWFPVSSSPHHKGPPPSQRHWNPPSDRATRRDTSVYRYTPNTRAHAGCTYINIHVPIHTSTHTHIYPGTTILIKFIHKGQ